SMAGPSVRQIGRLRTPNREVSSRHGSYRHPAEAIGAGVHSPVYADSPAIIPGHLPYLIALSPFLIVDGLLPSALGLIQEMVQMSSHSPNGSSALALRT